MGFKAEQFVKSVDENLFCAICTEVFEDPVSCKDGHTFCKGCIHKWLEINRKCPMDNNYLTKIYLFPQFTVKGIVDNLEVYCHPCAQAKAPSEGCGWVGKLQHLAHHRKNCQFQEMQCPHGCFEKIQKRKMKDHEKICDFRKVECEKCGIILLQLEKETHLRDDCLQALIFCPNRCQDEQIIVQIKRIDLSDHLSKVCPKALIDCPYKEQGCVVKIERQDVEKHVQENMAGHMMLLAKECSSLKKQNESLTDQYSSLSLRCSTLDQTNLELKKELKQFKEEFHVQLLSSSSYTWVLSDYPNLAKNHPNGSGIQSPPFRLRGERLRLSLYPNGKSAGAKEFVSLYLKKVEEDSQLLSDTSPNTSSNKSAIPFRLTVMSQKPDTDHISYQDKHVFTKKSNNWGWLKFMKSSDTILSSYCDNDRLIIQCTIQPDKPQ
ncbi:TNF receptor-associated factor family protein DDB_G0272340-like isoform X2 [Actinia tenebrosa]|uniref:TNF receptor-associated factor family protein DDB_G0272340-like isoform X2 n=1 Tax=Actinia tenebrosa TaxID=6105 RepID=A0A6P8HGA4_ACTTE|nr:TNF receptor-associated factor family protein DDB_G0272340-like isoform X2 [Actinia tenebrosa]